MKTHDVVGICNALVDILITAEDKDIAALGLKKGVMHLVDADRQVEVLGHFSGKQYATELGGSAMNAMRTLAQLGRKTVFAGMVSDDEFGLRVRARMQELGIVDRLGRGSEHTGSCVILITPDGERTMNTHLGASRTYGLAEVPYTDIETAKVLHFCGYQWDTDGQKAAIAKAITTAKANEALVSFDVADPFVVDRNRDAFLAVIDADADVVFANREEARMLFGGAPEDAAARIAKTGAIAVIKLGADGALVRQGDTVHKIAPVATKVVDTTAAGDMFAAGFLYGLTAGKSLDVCGKMAATIASDVISRVGAVVSAEGLEKLRKL
jgi:sugar/nucleoside kinase (ribokinase family)